MKWLLAMLFFLGSVGSTIGQSFVHPGGLHTREDLDRMKAQVAANAKPWIEGWNRMITDPLAQNTYSAAPQANMGSNRQRASRDAHAAYLNTLRWYISGDETYAECAVRICNAWSSSVNQVPTGTDIPGLSGIPIFEFALVGEILRTYSGWSSIDFARFKSMMLTYWYPVCHNFLVNHNGACITNYWTNWDAANIGAILAIGVLCDDQEKFDEAISYYKSGAGTGSIMNAVYFRHSPMLGQWQESGRDQEHAQLGVGLLASVCEVAWKQGIDLYEYDDNRLLAGAEYVALTNLWKPVPYKFYNNCQDARQSWVSINGRGRLDDRPIWEMIYNHYVVRKGLSAPYSQAMAQLMRPEHGSADHFGYGTLTFTLNGSDSPYPPSPIAPTPTDVVATAGVTRVTLKWSPSGGNTAYGYRVQRSTVSGGPYTTIASWADNTTPQYTDRNVANGTTYYYVIAANNQSGTSENSAEVSATPTAASAVLPTGWTRQDIGTVNVPGTINYADVGNNTFILSGSGTGIGGAGDSFSYGYGSSSGDCSITARLLDVSWNGGGGAQKVGIMIRESLAPNAKTLIMKLGDVGTRRAEFGTRSATGGTMTWGRGNDYTWIPAWFRLQRNGDTFTALESSDGVTWFTVGSATMPMASSYYVGLAVCSNGGVVNTTTFDNVKVVSEGVKPPAPTGLKGKAVNNKRIDLSWTGSPGAPSYSVKRSSTNGGPYETIATGLTDTTYSNTGLSANTTYYYVVSSASFAGESENSLEAVVTTHDLTIPHSPTGVIAVPGNANITLSWSAAEDAANYQVKRALTNEGPYTLIDTTTVTSYVDASASTGTTYYYVVSARNIKGESPNSTPVSAKLTTNAHSYWAFNETDGTTAFDVWGERHATTTGVSVVPGAAGNAIRIDAGSDVTLPPDVVSTLNDFTIAIWMKLDATSNWSRLFDFGSGTTNYMFLTPRHGATGNTIRYAIRTTSVAEQQINCPVTAVTGTWTHVAVTLSGTVGILYVNGIEVGRNNAMTLKPSDLGSTTQNWIGRSQFATDPRVSGLVDDLRIYSRALAPSEISDMFNALAPAPPANLIATGTNQVTLSWDASAEALLYNVKRSTVDGGPYTVVAANVSDTSYVDTGVSSGGPYYYIVTAKSGAFESTPSTQASVLLLPAVPTQITAAAWNGRIDLSWTASAGALTYDVKRAIAIEGPYTPIANVATQSFRDTELTNGINYYYVVSAVNTTGASANSSSASATPFANPNLSEWLHGDVGSIGAAGNAGYRDGVFTLHGSGADIWGNADGFHFMYQPLLGDGAIVARVVTQQNTYNSAKAGVMIRESLNANSTHAMVALAPGIGTEFIRRAATGGSSAATSAGNAPAPYWVRLVRSGNTFTAYRSANGIQWTMLGTPQTITMGSAAYIGLVLCSHNNAVLGQATFDNVNIATTTPVITSSSTAIGTFDSLFHYSIEATNSPYYFSATGLPDSLILDTHNGLITGKPLVSGMFPVTINTGNALGVDTDTVMLVIKRNQTIAFNALADKKVGDIDFDPQAIPTSGLPVSYTSSNTAVATIVDGKIHITGKGTTLITASQPGDSTFYASPPVSQSLTVIQLLHNPYGGVARVVPGVVEAEDFDTGGEGIAYHDITPLNVGLKYRRKEGVDIETCTEGGFNLSWMLNNEWLNYTLNVQEDGTYKIDLRVADVIGLGQLRIEIDGENKTGTIDLDPTKGIQRWATVSRTIELKSGLRAMRLFVERGGCNINKLTFTKIEDTRTDLSRMPSVQRNTQTEEMDFSDGCLLYPNPVVDKLTIVLDEEFGEGAEVHLFNDKGQRIVYEKTQGNIHILDLENAAPGIYLLKIRNAKEVITKKLVKI